MLEMRHVTKVFNRGSVDEKVALNDLSLTLNDGDFVTVIGGNGAGKSTMQNAICGTWQPDSGQIILDGIDVTALPEHKRAKYLGRVYQDPMTGTAAGMQIEENLALAARRGKRRTLRPMITKTEREDYKNLLAELGLGLPAASVRRSRCLWRRCKARSSSFWTSIPPPSTPRPPRASWS